MVVNFWHLYLYLEWLSLFVDGNRDWDHIDAWFARCSCIGTYRSVVIIDNSLRRSHMQTRTLVLVTHYVLFLAALVYFYTILLVYRNLL